MVTGLCASLEQPASTLHYWLMSHAGKGRVFPTTELSLIAAVAGDDPEARMLALETLIAVYWRPAYLHLRLKWCPDRESAEDLTQTFFSRTLDGELFARYDPARARFRTFLRTALDHLAANDQRDSARLKRGGGAAHISLDFDSAEREVAAWPAPHAASDPDLLFHREWIRVLFTRAVDALRAQAAGKGHDQRFAIFSRVDLESNDVSERPSYRDLAAEFDLPVTQVTNHLAWARREFRRLVLEQLRQLCGSDAEFRAEARELFGVDPA